MAYDILLDNGFNKNTVKDVSQTILTHGSKQYKIKTKEQKILVTSDSLSNFKSPFYVLFNTISANQYGNRWNALSNT